MVKLGARKNGKTTIRRRMQTSERTDGKEKGSPAWSHFASMRLQHKSTATRQQKGERTARNNAWSYAVLKWRTIRPAQAW